MIGYLRAVTYRPRHSWSRRRLGHLATGLVLYASVRLR